MLHPEVEEGNIEYKRFILNLSPHRFEQLTSQMKWRLSEGEGEAIYYIGVEDDGSIYGLNIDQFKDSIVNIKKLAKNCNAKMNNVKKLRYEAKYYYKIIIKSDKIKKYDEKRILLLGESGIGKTTFLAYLINNKLNKNSRMFILNHKHEIESGKTSSFNYKHLIFKNTKYVFLDTPGDKLYNKTLNRILLSIDIDLILYFEGFSEWELKKLYSEYANFENIPWIDLNIHSNNNKFPNINMLNPPKQDNILNYFHDKIKFKSNIISTNELDFLVLQTYPHEDLGWILSGYLKSGELKVNDKLIWYGNDQMDVSIQSIHVNNLPVNIVKKNQIVTICLDKFNNIKQKPKYGFLSNLNFNNQRTIVIQWIYLNDELTDTIKGFIRNNKVTIKKIGRKADTIIIYHILKYNNIFNLKENIFLFENGFGKII